MAPSLWAEYTNSEGRTYWSNSETKQSVWDKPEELQTPFEREIAKTEWKQYASKGRPYYVHNITKETKWELPDELVAIKERLERKKASRRSASPSDRGGDDRALTRYRSLTPESEDEEELEVITMPPGGFPSVEKAEEGFIYLLKREKIDEKWTWDQAMRRIIMDPLYKALDTLAQKKAVFEKYTGSIVANRQAEKDARIAKMRPALIKLFTQSGYIKSYSTMKTADRVFARDRHWREAKPDERRLILEEYTADLKRREEEEEKRVRQESIQALGGLIKQLDITVQTPWRAAHKLISNSSAFAALQKVDTIDVLNVFDDYTRQLEQDFEQESRQYKAEQVRRARKARDGFKALLAELQSRGDLTRSSKWKDTFPKIRGDERYTALLGLPGSSPLDLFMDAVDDMSEEVERAAAKLERVVKVDANTTYEQFEEGVKDEQTHIDPKLRREAFDLIQERIAQAAADEARRAERRKRHRIEDFRYALKKVRHLELDMSYEQAVPLIKDLPEYKDITDEEDRKSAYEKFVKRQKEKIREEEDRRRDRRDRDRDRDRRHTPEGERNRKRPRVSDRERERGKNEEIEEGEI